MSHVTTHVLDTALGRPAAGVPVRLERPASHNAGADGHTGSRTVIASGATDDDGRARDLGPDRLAEGSYRLVFDTAHYFARTGQQGFYPEVAVAFELADEEAHYHVPLLLSPFGYATYRGS
ncbi:5-hydroxyisourate hydrolase [Streptomonospora alba]|uniref:5-hydroxyisourate hydrolase n=1 Tax=Streptomonospora alba TaxID=183763 RepID=A0A0C2FGY2_9ACTN|nr:hydroxyisourate hydrolase [Streptomonospora alba]KIH98534.1 5-hydroxyisourate hydrolase [Streptomonospora alba]